MRRRAARARRRGERQNFTLEALEDLQVALEELLGREHGDGAVTLELELSDGSLQARIGPFAGSALRPDLKPSGAVGLRRVLDSTVDGVEVETRDDGDWVLITKAVHT